MEATTTNNKLMRAVVQDAYGSAETLRGDRIVTPQPAADEVLIEVEAAGVDRGVWHLMTGLPYLVRLTGFGLTRPKQPVPGLDMSGRVIAVGEDVERFEVGDEVFGIATGAYAEFAVAKEKKLSHKPSSITFEQASVAAISGITALQALTDQGKLEAGQSVLVIGASGGVGSYVVQLAKAMGAEVTGVASGSKAEFVSSLGADHVIDYRTVDYLDGSHRYDLIIDTGGGNPLRKLRRALVKDGTLVIVGAEGGGKVTGGIGRQIRAALTSPFVSQRLGFFISQEHHRHIDRLAEYLAGGDVVPAAGLRYSLDDVNDAIDDLTSGNVEGKSVVIVKEGN